MKSDFEYDIDIGDEVVCCGDKRGIVEDVLSYGWLRIKLLPDIAKWDVIHTSQVVSIEKKED